MKKTDQRFAVLVVMVSVFAANGCAEPVVSRPGEETEVKQIVVGVPITDQGQPRARTDTKN